MIWVALAALSLPIWLVIGGLLGALWNRRQVRRTPNALPCKTRSFSAEDGSGSGVVRLHTPAGSTTSCW